MIARRLWCPCALLLLAPALAGFAADADPYGDPLPEGAKARLGTARLRVGTYSLPTLTPDGKSLYATTAGGLVRLDPATGAEQGKSAAPLLGIPAAFSADGKRAMSVGADRVTVWGADTGKQLARVERRLPPLDAAAALSADGRTLAIGGVGDRAKKEPVTVLVWDVVNDKEMSKITAPQNEYAGVAVSADGKTVASWGSHYDPDAKGPPDADTSPGRFVNFWSAADGKALAKFRSSGYVPSAVAFSPTGALVAVANNNGSIDLVDPKTGESKLMLLGRSRIGRAVAFSPDGATLAATSDDGTVQRWRVADGVRLSTTEPPVPNPASARVRLVDNEKGVAWAQKGLAAVAWEVPSGKLIGPRGGHTSTVRSIAVTPDGKHAVTSSEDGAALKWELATGKPAGEVVFRGPYSGGFAGYEPLALFNGAMSHALIRDAGGVGVYDAATLTQQYVVPVPFEGYSYGVFSADGAKVIVSTNSYTAKKPARVAVWDVAATKRLVSVEVPGVGSVHAALAPDGKHLVTTGRKVGLEANNELVVTAWDVATGAKRGESTEEAGYAIPFVAVAADNKTAVAASRVGLVTFDLATGRGAKLLDAGRSALALPPLFSADGKKLAVAFQADFTGHKTEVQVLEWPTGKVLHKFAVFGSPTAMAFSPDGKSLVTGSADTTAVVWNTGP